MVFFLVVAIEDITDISDRKGMSHEKGESSNSIVLPEFRPEKCIHLHISVGKGDRKQI